MISIRKKERILLKELKSYRSVAIAYSGGVDSAYLADCAHEALGSSALIILADSPSLPREELQQAIKTARERGWNLRVIKTGEHLIEGYLENKGERCFHCKNELFTQMALLAGNRRMKLAFGAIEDDKNDHRPGARAAADHNVLAPLQKAGLYKKEIRILSKRRGLSTAEKAAFACLGSRFLTGTRIDLESMSRVEKTEAILLAKGCLQYRVRHHGDLCRIEVDPADFDKLLAERCKLVESVKKNGYKFVTLDLSGYVAGSSA